MLFQDGVLAGPAVLLVDGHAVAVAEHPDQRPCVDDLGLLADKLVRDAVIVLVAPEIDTAVVSDLQAGVALDLEVLGGQRRQRRPLKREEALLPGEIELLHPPLVVCPDEFPDRLVELLNGVEHPVAQQCVYVPVHRRLEVVGDQYLGNAAHGLEALCDGEQKVLAVLGRDAGGEDKVRRGHAGHEHLHLDLLSGVDVDIRELVAGEVDHQPLSRGVQVLDDGTVASGALCLRILPVMEPELRQTVSFGVFRPVFFPQKPQGDSLAPQLALDVRQHLPELVEPRVAVGGVAVVKPALKLGVLQHEKPLQTLRERLGLVDVVVDGLLVHPQDPGDGAVGGTVPVHD